MPNAVLDIEQPARPPTAGRKFSVSEFIAMDELGQLGDGRVELIRGEILNKMPIKRPHAVCVSKLVTLFGKYYAAGQVIAQVSMQIFRHSMPEPDFLVLRTADESGDYVHWNEAQLVAEVSYNTLSSDLAVKAEIYAEASIPEYWVVDLVGRCVVVHTSPVDGHYTSVTSVAEGSSITPLCLSEASISVADILPPMTPQQLSTE